MFDEAIPIAKTHGLIQMTKSLEQISGIAIVPEILVTFALGPFPPDALPPANAQ